MKFNKQAVQRELDLGAQELEKKGYIDLAEKVDYYNYRLMGASDEEVPLIKRALSRVIREATRRDTLTRGSDARPTNVRKAEHATQQSRRAADARRDALRRRLQTIIARRKKSADVLQRLRMKRAERIAKDKTKEKVATNTDYSRKELEKIEQTRKNLKNASSKPAFDRVVQRLADDLGISWMEALKVANDPDSSAR